MYPTFVAHPAGSKLHPQSISPLRQAQEPRRGTLNPAPLLPFWATVYTQVIGDVIEWVDPPNLDYS
jgi:hypothetical protein